MHGLRLTVAAAAAGVLIPLAALAQGTTGAVQGTQAETVKQGTAPTAPGPAVGPAGDPGQGATKNAQCIGCHGIAGYRASFPSVYSVPMIAGQSARYLESALQQYRKGERSHPTMRAVAGSLSDQDILDLAAYYAGEGSK